MAALKMNFNSGLMNTTKSSRYEPILMEMRGQPPSGDLYRLGDMGFS